MITALARSANGSTEILSARVSMVTAPATEPVTLQEAKLQCRVDADDENTLFRDLSMAARMLCESEPSADGTTGGTGRSLVTQTFDLKLDGFPWGYASAVSTFNQGYSAFWERQYLGGSGMRPIVVPRPPLVSVTSITYVDTDGVTQTWSSSLYTVDAPAGDFAEPGRIYPVFGQVYPVTRAQPNAVTIRCVAGYGAAAAVPAALKAGMRLLIGNWWMNREAGQIVRGSADVLPFGVDALWQSFRVM